MTTSENAILYACWIPMGAWEVRVDGPHQDSGHQHIHIRRKRKGKGEFSWNKDGTRHDKHRFPFSEGMIGKAKEIAAKELNVPISSLEFLTGMPKTGRFSILQTELASHVITRVLCDVDSLVLISENWLVVVATAEVVDPS